MAAVRSSTRCMPLSGTGLLIQLPLPNSTVFGVVDCRDMTEPELLKDSMRGIAFRKCLRSDQDG